MTIRALIVDDEALARETVRLALGAFPGWVVAGECRSVSEARARMRETPVDVVFLDMQMPGDTGTALARDAAALAQLPVVVFVTAFEQYAVEAFDLHALDYVLKPFDDARMADAIQRVERLLSLRDRAAYADALRDFVARPASGAASAPFLTRVTVRSVGRIESIRVADIQRISAAGNYVELHLGGRRLLHRVTISRLADRLDPAMFVRVHRSTIVRIDLCVALSVVGDGLYALELRDGASVAVSARHAPGVRALLSRDT